MDIIKPEVFGKKAPAAAVNPPGSREAATFCSRPFLPCALKGSHAVPHRDRGPRGSPKPHHTKTGQK